MIAIPGVALLALALIRLLSTPRERQLSPWIWVLPAALLALPLVQLIPLPAAWVDELPGRAAVARDLSAAGVVRTTATWSLDPLATERCLFFLLAPAGLLVASFMLSAREQEALVLVAVAFACGSTLLGLWQVMEGPRSTTYLYEFTNRGQAVGLFANRNHLASLLAVSVPLACALLIDRYSRVGEGRRDPICWALAAAIVLVALGVTATHSRAGFVLLMLSVFAGAVIALLFRPGTGAGARRWLQICAIVAGLAIVQFTLIGLLTRLESDPLDDLRWSTLAPRTMAAARPFYGSGTGFGTFTQAYYQLGDQTADIPQIVNHAHNDYIELWLEGGVLAILLTGVVLGFVAWAMLFRLGSRSANQRRTAPRTEFSRTAALPLAAGFALLLLAVHSIVDYPLRTLSLASLAAVLLAVLAGHDGRLVGAQSHRRRMRVPSLGPRPG